MGLDATLLSNDGTLALFWPQVASCQYSLEVRWVKRLHTSKPKTHPLRTSIGNTRPIPIKLNYAVVIRMSWSESDLSRARAPLLTDRQTPMPPSSYVALKQLVEEPRCKVPA